MAGTKGNSYKILHVVSINGIGGAEKLLLYLMPALQKINKEVHCLIFYREPFFDDAVYIGTHLEQNEIQVTYRKYDKVADSEPVRFLSYFVSENRFNIVHSHLKHTDLWFALLKWRGEIQVPVVTTFPGYRDEYQNKFGLEWRKRKSFTAYYWLTKFICKQFDGYVFISNALKEFYNKSGLLSSSRYCKVIYHGTKLPVSKPEVVDQPKTFNYSIVLPGRLLKLKGHHYLIEAAGILRSEFPDLKVHFYGSGPEEANLEQLVSSKGLIDSVFFHGFRNDLEALMGQHDIAVIPSTGEAFGLVFFDAFKACLPVVAFDMPASNEIIKHNFNGLLAKPHDVNSLVECIRLLFKSGELRKRLSENASSELSNHYSIERMANDYLNFYKEIVSIST